MVTPTYTDVLLQSMPSANKEIGVYAVHDAMKTSKKPTMNSPTRAFLVSFLRRKVQLFTFSSS